jgi:hypothetical protein
VPNENLGNKEDCEKRIVQLAYDICTVAMVTPVSAATQLGSRRQEFLVQGTGRTHHIKGSTHLCMKP